MRHLVLSALLAVGCGSPKSPSPPVAPTPEAKTEPTEEVEQQPPPADADDWNPDQPIGEEKLATLKLGTRYVVVDGSAVCPTREQAMARACGNSVESTKHGIRVEKGTAIPVIGDAPIDGLWKSLRYQKAGVLPGWIRADDLADAPETPALDAFDSRPDLANARDAAGMSAKELGKLPKDTLVKWQRTRTIKLGVSIDEIYVYTDNAAVMLPPLEVDESYARRHDCMMEADCFELAYTAEDEVSILARATGKKLAPPDDPDGIWSGPKQPMPLFEVVVLADRFGAFPRPADP